METVKYKGFNVILSDMDYEKCTGWKKRHWKCTVKDPINRTQMSFDVFGGSLATMQPLEALFIFIGDAITYMNVDDAYDIMEEFGYDDYSTAKAIYKSLEKAYYKCRKFIGSDDDIIEIANELKEEWG